MNAYRFRLAAAAAIFASSASIAYADNLTLYCAADEAWCQQVARGFEEKTGIPVDMSR